jgi:hypothetical protein
MKDETRFFSGKLDKQKRLYEVFLMNGVNNAVFVVVLFMTMVSFTYLYSISDKILQPMYAKINAIAPNDMTDNGYNSYVALRDFLFTGLNRVVLPFLLFLALTSSFINRNQTMIGYVIQSIAVVLITPMLVYVFAEVLSNLTAVSIINSAYLFTTYFDNFLYILIANMLLSLASFVFVQKQVTYA